MMNTYRVPGEFEPQESVLTVWPVNEWATDTLEVDAVTVERFVTEQKSSSNKYTSTKISINSSACNPLASYQQFF